LLNLPSRGVATTAGMLEVAAMMNHPFGHEVQGTEDREQGTYSSPSLIFVLLGIAPFAAEPLLRFV
jgi:hypothetical protein